MIVSFDIDDALSLDGTRVHDADPGCQMMASSTSCVMNSTVFLCCRQIVMQFRCMRRARVRVECRERLIHQAASGLVREHARDLDALLHAAGQLAGYLCPWPVNPTRSR
jgi:hypothetical protein